MKNKKYLLLVITCLIIFTYTAQAGEIKVNVNDGETQRVYESEQGEIIIEEYGTPDINYQFNPGSLKINGGLITGFLSLNIKELNNELGILGFKPFSNQLVLVGGGGLIGFSEGSRLGGYGLKGSVITVNNNQKASYYINYGGFLYEQGIYADQKLDISLGSLFGGGTQKIDLIYGEVNDFADPPQRNIYESSFFALEPRVNFHFQYAPFMGLDISAGYLYTYIKEGNWKADNNMVNVPMDNLSSPVYSLRFSFGF